MTQTRIWNYGDTFTAFRADTVQFALHEPGVYRGYDIIVTDTDKIELTTGFLMLPSGIVVGEDVNIELILAIAPAAATTYTVTIRHIDSDVIGGAAATYAIETGELLPAAVTDGIVLGYIRHPGGGVALSTDFIFPVRKVLDQDEDSIALEPTVLAAPSLSGSWFFDLFGANTTTFTGFTSPVVFETVETSGLGPAPPAFETSTARIPLVAGKFRPFSLEIRALIDPNSLLLVSLLDTLGAPVTLTAGSSIGPSAVFTDFTVSIDYASGVFTEGDSYLLTLEFRTPQLDSIEIQSVTIHYDPLP